MSRKYVLDTTDTRFVSITSDKLSARYTGKAAHSYDIGTIRFDQPFSHTDVIAYFEVTIEEAGPKSSLFIGVVDKDFPLNRFPGWEPNSYGYSGEEGRKYSESMKGESYGETFSSGDVIGCGINFADHFIFFTKNGKYLDVAFRGVEGEMYGAVGLHEVSQAVTLNSGSSPFRFDLPALLQSERRKKVGRVEGVEVAVAQVNDAVEGYLLLHGYSLTLHAFRSSLHTHHSIPPNTHAPTSSNHTNPSSKDKGKDVKASSKDVKASQTKGGSDSSVATSGDLAKSVSQRGELRRMVMAGDVKSAMDLFLHLVPSQSDSGDKVGEVEEGVFVLECQRVIEDVKLHLLPRSKPKETTDKHKQTLDKRSDKEKRNIDGKGEEKRVASNVASNVTSNVASEREKLAMVVETSRRLKPFLSSFAPLVHTIMGLLAYREVEGSVLGDLLSSTHRELVADHLNAIVLDCYQRKSEQQTTKEAKRSKESDVSKSFVSANNGRRDDEQSSHNKPTGNGEKRKKGDRDGEQEEKEKRYSTGKGYSVWVELFERRRPKSSLEESLHDLATAEHLFLSQSKDNSFYNTNKQSKKDSESSGDHVGIPELQSGNPFLFLSLRQYLP